MENDQPNPLGLSIAKTAFCKSKGIVFSSGASESYKLSSLVQLSTCGMSIMQFPVRISLHI